MPQLQYSQEIDQQANSYGGSDNLFSDTRGKLYALKTSEDYLQRGVTRCRFYTCNRTSHDETMSTHTTIPFWANPLQLNILKSCLFKPFNVLFLLWKEHPHICKKARQPECRINRTNYTSLSSKFQNPICFLDTTLWVGPVLNTEKEETCIS